MVKTLRQMYDGLAISDAFIHKSHKSDILWINAGFMASKAISLVAHICDVYQHFHHGMLIRK